MEKKNKQKKPPHSMSSTVRQAQNQHHLVLQQPYGVDFKIVTYRDLATSNLTWSLHLDLKHGSAIYYECEPCAIVIFIKKWLNIGSFIWYNLTIVWLLNFSKPQILHC